MNIDCINSDDWCDDKSGNKDNDDKMIIIGMITNQDEWYQR